MARVTLDNVSKIYHPRHRPAVDALSLDIQDREFVVIVGPSGCGKSTTLRMIAGLEHPTSGTVTIGDRVVNDIPPAARDIAMVFQNYALFPHMSVYRNMAFGLHLRRRHLGMSHEQIRSQVIAAAQRLGLAALLDRKPRSLSGGQQQRVALGRAIVRNPKAFLFDEPLSHLDAKLRLETRAEIKKLHRHLQTTTLYVTHDQEEAMTLGDRIVVMKDGRILQCAPPLEVYDRPINRFVAGFVGTPAMNFLPGRLSPTGHFVTASQKLQLSPPIMAAASAYMDQPLLLGIRPENLSPTPLPQFLGSESFITAKVSVIEPLGDRVDISLTADGGVPLVCRADAHQFGKLPTESIIRVYVDLGRVHLFEPGDNGVNITLTRDPSHAAA
jgi:multiple sugar transport system ATP-binding protein